MRTVLLLWIVLAGTSCAVQKKYNPSRKFSAEALKEDFRVFRGVLEETHPSLYWYTSRDSMDHYFRIAESKLTDSLPEYRFRYILSYVTSKIRCGHTTVMPSKGAISYSERVRNPSLPFGVKVWPDTVMVTFNLNRKDSIVKRGSIIKAIEGRPIQAIVDSFFSHLSADGYNTTHKYQSLSNGAVFRNLYAAIYGLRQKMQVTFLDSAGTERTAMVDVYNPAADTPRVRLPVPKLSRRERKKLQLQATRSLRIDTALNTAYMEVNSFTKGNRLRSFFRQSFRTLKKQNVSNLVIDLRSNGGGHVPLSNLLTSYIADKPFKIADSLYAIRKGSSYAKYRSQYFLNQLFFVFMTRLKPGGTWHFTWYENKYFKPKKQHHFEGTTYILTGGNTFSAASLVASSLKEQEDVVIVGEETGGSAYGNSAWLIPDVTLPNTGVRFRLPLFRLVIDKNAVKGQSIVPEVESLPNTPAILRNADFKMEKVRTIISGKKASAKE